MAKWVISKPFAKKNQSVVVKPEKQMWHLPLLMIPIFGLVIMKFEGVKNCTFIYFSLCADILVFKGVC